MFASQTLRRNRSQAGKRLFNEAKGGTTAQRSQRYESAIAEFGRTGSNTAEGTNEELLGYWWTVAAYAHLWELKKNTPAQNSIKQDLLTTANVFARRVEAIQAAARGADYSPTRVMNPLLNMQEVRLAKAYIGEIEEKIGKTTKVNEVQMYGNVNANCGECYSPRRVR